MSRWGRRAPGTLGLATLPNRYTLALLPRKTIETVKGRSAGRGDRN